MFARNITDFTIDSSIEMEFSDLAESHWGYENIQIMVQSGLMKGYPDGTFEPDRIITRAEMASIALKWRELEEIEGSSFTDTDTRWAKGSIEALKETGVLNGYPDGTYQPERGLTRAEAVTVMNRLLEREVIAGTIIPTWPDVPTTHWAFKEVESVTSRK